MPYIDPLLPVLKTPSEEFLRNNPVRFGNYSAIMTPKQWEITFARERIIVAKGSVRSGKTIGAIFRGIRFSIHIPDNRGIIGRLYRSDLRETAQRDFNEIADATGLVKDKNDRNTVMYCVDPKTNEIDRHKRTSEISFQHFDKPNHLKGRGIGWFWMEEGSENKPPAFYRLIDRLSHGPAGNSVSGWITTNPEGRNWIWKYAFSPEDLAQLTSEARLQRRGILTFTRENYHLSSAYIQTLLNNAPAEWVKRYIDGEDDVFEGQAFKEYDPDIHELNGDRLADCKGFDRGEPPLEWERFLGIDVGGANPWGFEFAAVDPWGNTIFYDEIWGPQTWVGAFKLALIARVRDRNFVKQVIDYENLTAKEEINRLNIAGLRVVNARKRGKIESINKFARYLHPNPDRVFPPWHPRAGEKGAPAIYITERCKHLKDEIPQQKWKADATTGAGDLDYNVAHDSFDGARYVIIERPEPIELLNPPSLELQAQLDPTHVAYWVNRHEEEKEMRKHGRRWYWPFGGVRIPRTRRLVV